MLRILLFTLGICCGLQAYPQHHPQEQCATMHVLQEQLLADPGLAQRMAQIEQEIQHLLSIGGAEGSNIITIPVVFHIVHNGEPIGVGANITDAQVLSQLQVLNEDFRRQNPDTGNTRTIFKPVAADTKIQFCLATSDPNGNPTTGINRINGGRSTWTTSQMNNQMKPGTIWNRNHYLNFWTASLTSGLLGYAQFPGGNSATDGVVVGYQYVGRPPFNPNNNNYNGGRTGTHEVGHWLNLRHIWGDGNCNFDDFVDDTPLAASSNSGCPLSANSCVDFPIDYPDMVENYMDYTRDNCMNIFTQGQANRMMAALNGPRSSIKQSPGCISLNLFPYQVRIVDSLSGLPVHPGQVRLEGNYFTYIGHSDAAGYINLPGMLADTYKVYAGAWGHLTKKVGNQMLIDSTTAHLLIELRKGYYDDFLFDFGWTATGNATTGMWVRGIPIGTTYQNMTINPDADVPHDFGDYCYMTGNGGGAAGNDDVDDGYVLLTSPIFKTAGMADPHLSFYRWWANTGGSTPPNDSLIIMITNGTATDTLNIILPNEPLQGQWVYEEYRIADFVSPTDSMRIMVYTADWPGTGHLVEAGFDLFVVTDSFVAMLPPVASFSTDRDTICTGETVTFSNSSTNYPVTFYWEFQGGTPMQSTQRDPVVRFDLPGSYTVKLRATNPAGSDSILHIDRITVLPGPEMNLLVGPISCFGGDDGVLTAQVSGGTPPLAYAWSNGGSDSISSGLRNGAYSLTVTDANGCTVARSHYLAQPVRLFINTSSIADTSGQGHGQAHASVLGGSAPYTYTWNDPAGQSTATATGLFKGTYSVTVTDSKGCTDSATVAVSGPTGTITNRQGPLALYPNPTSGTINIAWPADWTGDVHIQAFDLTGRKVLAQIANANSGSATLQFDGLSNGIYLIYILAGNQAFTAKIQLQQ